MSLLGSQPHRGAPVEGRRHGVIAFADLVGFTILSEVALEATNAAWADFLLNRLRPLAERHGCRFLKSTGDGAAAEFSDVRSALAWARDLHREAAAADHPDRPPLAFRIGIDAGEVYATPADVYGLCVNVAARLQEHAPPGGIAITASCLEDRTGWQDLGPVRLRNIAAPVPAFIMTPASPPRVPRRAPLEGTPSVAVMPFESIGGDGADSYFCDGVIEDIILSLGALHELMVISRGATLGWSHGRHDPCVVGRVLGVRYVLAGTLRQRGDGLRLSVTLRETAEGDALWQERYDIPRAEIFAVQDDVSARVVAGIAPQIRAAELRRALRKAPSSLSAYDHTLRGLSALDGLQRERFEEAEQHLEAAMREDAGYGTAAAWLAQWHSLAIGQAWTKDPVRDAAAVKALAHRAVQLDPRNALGHTISGHYRAYHQRDPQSALPFFDRALEVGPSHALSWTLRSASLSYLGRAEEALAAAQRGFSLSPQGADRYYFRFFLGLAQHCSGDHAAAAGSMRLSLMDSPGFTSAHRILIAALHAQGHAEEARTVAGDMIRREPNFRLSHYARERQPFADEALAGQLMDALGATGIPA
jgi:adenylate cyclase